MSPHAVQFQEALEALQFFTGYLGGWTLFERRREGAVKRFWRAAMAPGLPDVIRALDERYGDEIAFGLPQRERFNGGVGVATVLWVRIEGTEQLRKARAFRPLPSVVLQEGGSSRRLLIWGLNGPVVWTDVVRFNKRIAHRLGAPKKWAEPESLWIPCPGTRLQVGRTRPVPVVCSRLTTATYDPLQVAGRLRDAPDPNAWRDAA